MILEDALLLVEYGAEIDVLVTIHKSAVPGKGVSVAYRDMITDSAIRAYRDLRGIEIAECEGIKADEPRAA